MFSTALWLIDQEYRAVQWLVTGSPKSDLSTAEKLFATTAGTVWLGAHGMIAAQPYNRIAKASGDLDMFVRRAVLNEPIGFSMSKGKVTARFAKHSSKKMFAAKVGARFIPYAGWALFAYDMWKVGEWIGENFNPVDTYRDNS